MPMCISADGGHFAHMMWTRWSRLTWHNFVNVAGNWIKIHSLALIGTHNRHVKFGWKIPKRFGKIATSPQEGIFLTHCTNPHYCIALCRVDWQHITAVSADAYWEAHVSLNKLAINYIFIRTIQPLKFSIPRKATADAEISVESFTYCIIVNL